MQPDKNSHATAAVRLKQIGIEDIACVILLAFFAMQGAIPGISPNQANEMTNTAATGLMKAAGIGDLTIDELVAMKIQGVTPEYVRELHDQGLHPDADTLVAFRVQNVTAAYIQELRGLGFNPGPDEIIAFKVQNVNADYVRGLKEAGIQPNPDEIIALKSEGVVL